MIELLTGSGFNTDAFFGGASADGSRVFFRTTEPIGGTGDFDAASDVYKAESGAITLLSASGTAEHNAIFGGASADGSRVFFTTSEQIAGTGDADLGEDVYKAEGGAITLLSGSGDNTGANFRGASADGTRVFFGTTEQVAGTGDGDAASDVYKAEGGALTLLSGSGANDHVFFARASTDGGRVFFTTAEPIAGTGDGDLGEDLYKAEGGAINLLSGSGANNQVLFVGASADGGRVFFVTPEPIAGTGDADAASDVYKAESGAITLLSGSGAPLAAFFDGASADGSRVFFDTAEQIAGTGDVDLGGDVYKAESGAITLLSGSGDNTDAFFGGASADGSRVFFTTDEAITGADADDAFDVYKAEGGGITLLSGSGFFGPGASFSGASADGSRVFFSTFEQITGAGDVDPALDVYKAEGGAITLLSGGGANTNAVFGGASADGSRVFFTTTEQIAGTGDADMAEDIYVSRPAPPPASPPPAPGGGAAPSAGPTGQRAAALKKCKKKKGSARKRCKKRARKLPA